MFSRKYFEAAKNPAKGFPEKWKLFFKLFCYLRPENVPFDSIEAAFMYEQVSVLLALMYTVGGEIVAFSFLV